MTERKLLELAAKAAGYTGKLEIAMGRLFAEDKDGRLIEWNPLDDDGDAFCLAVKLNLDLHFDACDDGVSVTCYGNWDQYNGEQCEETYEQLGLEATRRAIVRAAAEIGKSI